MPKLTAALSKSFNDSRTKKTPQVTGIIGPYYLASRDGYSDNGYDGNVTAFESVKLGGGSGREEAVPVMTLPVPKWVGGFTWNHLIGQSHGFRDLKHKM
jgi:hypothetical protein